MTTKLLEGYYKAIDHFYKFIKVRLCPSLSLSTQSTFRMKTGHSLPMMEEERTTRLQSNTEILVKHYLTLFLYY